MTMRNQVLMAILTDAHTDPVDGERNVMIKCPMAAYTGLHRNLRDSRPSMGIKHSDNGNFLVNCFTCGYRAPSLSKMFEDLYARSSSTHWLPFVDRAVKLEQLDLDGILAIVDYGYRISKIKKESSAPGAS